MQQESIKSTEPVYIIGAGAVGKTLAVLLKEAGREVHLIRGRATEKGKSNEEISIELGEGVILKKEMPISTLDEFSRIEGVVVVTIKSHGNSALASALRKKTSNSPIVLLQNGLGIEEPFMNEGFRAIMRCVLFLTGQQTDANNIRFRPVRPSPIGIIDGTKELLTNIVASLNTAAFPFIVEQDIQPIIWKKAIINSVFNTICPLLNIDNGIFHREKEVLDMGRDIIREGMAVAKQKGINLEEEEIVKQLLQISVASDGQLISTLQDMNAGRLTEIESLNLAIARTGKENGLESGVKMNYLLGNLIKWKSKLHLKTTSK